MMKRMGHEPDGDLIAGYVAGLDGTLCALDAAAHGENISADAPNAALEADTHPLDALGRLAEDP
jgi:hypothetical protein